MPITILWKKQPEDSRYRKGSYCRVSKQRAYQFIEQGLAVCYDPDTQTESNPLLEEDFPHREQLFENGIYSKQELLAKMPNLQRINGISPKRHQDIKSALEPLEG